MFIMINHYKHHNKQDVYYDARSKFTPFRLSLLAELCILYLVYCYGLCLYVWTPGRLAHPTLVTPNGNPFKK